MDQLLNMTERLAKLNTVGQDAQGAGFALKDSCKVFFCCCCFLLFFFINRTMKYISNVHFVPACVFFNKFLGMQQQIGRAHV